MSPFCSVGRLVYPEGLHFVILRCFVGYYGALAEVSSGKLPRESFAHTCLCLASFPLRGFGLHCESLKSGRKFLLVISDLHACVLPFQQLDQGSASSQDAAHLASPLSKVVAAACFRRPRSAMQRGGEPSLAFWVSFRSSKGHLGPVSFEEPCAFLRQEFPKVTPLSS